MQEIDLRAYMSLAQEAALVAGKSIMDVYLDGKFNIQFKSDQSPITLADQAAHQASCEILKKSGLPILSEEGAMVPFTERKNWDIFWLVDPLDGTKEFIKRSGEFTVNIALIEKGIPIYGVIYSPVPKVLYHGGKGIGAFKVSAGQLPETLHPALANKIEAVVGSKSHMNTETEAFIHQYFPNLPLLGMGSSLKLMLLAEQKAQVYPRFGPTMEWDIAAGHAIVTAIGGVVMSWPDQEPLVYNKENLLNPAFIASSFPLNRKFVSN